jgi:hypothetical protein
MAGMGSSAICLPPIPYLRRNVLAESSFREAQLSGGGKFRHCVKRNEGRGVFREY